MTKRSTRGRRRNRRPTDSIPAKLDNFEKELYSKGVGLIAGIDEAGRGPLAGPVVAAAVILPRCAGLSGIRDSKKLTPKQRDRFYEKIMKVAVAHGVGIIEPEEIDKVNIFRASLKAMRVAVDNLSVNPEYLLIDGPYGIEHSIPQQPIKKGDELSRSIAAASIIAKVTRDRIMCEMERVYPKFGFSVHKGYGTVKHFEELASNGPTPIHRRTFLKNFSISSP